MPQQQSLLSGTKPTVAAHLCPTHRSQGHMPLPHACLGVRTVVGAAVPLSPWPLKQAALVSMIGNGISAPVA